ncbi:epoxide hydrolase 4-like [Lineus longissimus]|uniref:epoxide hydrolase 4-like n=1 Tax=Lineus longissimus TaxID=88925 RepID=UPI002B4E78A6
MGIVKTGIVLLIGSFWGSIVLLRSIFLIFTDRAKFLAFRVRETPPSCLSDNDIWKHDSIKLKDVKIHYVSAGDPNKPLMLFLHGFPEFWFSWRYQLREFCKDYRCIAIDMRGFGDSDKPSGMHHYEMGKLTTDVKDVIEGLGYKACTLVAHDWGAAVAWSFAYEHADLVDKLIILNVPHSRARHDNFSFKQFLASWYIMFFQLPYLPEWYMRRGDQMIFNWLFNKPPSGREGMVTPEEIEAWKYQFSQPGAWTSAINYYRANIRTDRKQWGKITKPTLIIWGVRDIALTELLCDGSVKYCEDVIVKKLDATHWVMQDKPDEVNKCMREFLA